METLKRQHRFFNIALTAFIVVPEILSFAIGLIPSPPSKLSALVAVVVIILITQVINFSSSRYKSAKAIGEKLPAGRDRDAFLAYAASAKRCGWIVVVCWLVGYVAKFALFVWGKSTSFELLFLAQLIIVVMVLLVIIGAAIKTGKHLRNLPDVDVDLPESETENSEGKN